MFANASYPLDFGSGAVSIRVTENVMAGKGFLSVQKASVDPHTHIRSRSM